VLSLKPPGNRQLHARIEIANLGKLAMAEFSLIHEKTERTVCEFRPVRTAGDPRGPGANKGNQRSPKLCISEPRR
jgi:hypothetical protein